MSHCEQASVLPRIAFVFTHRIQYFTNLLDELSRRGQMRLTAVYAHQTGSFNDPGFGMRICWDNRADAHLPSATLPDSARRPHGAFLSSFSRQLGKALDEFRPDLVHLNGYAHAIQWQAWLWAQRRNVPMLLRGDGDTLRGDQGWRAVVRRWPAQVFTRRASHVFFQGEENRKYWIARGASPQTMSWLPCVSDTEVFHGAAFASEETRCEFRRAHGAGPEDVVFIVSGKLENRKRPFDALRMLRQLESAKIKVWFLGSGPLENELKALALSLGVAGRAYWWGFRNQTQIPSVLQAGDVLLHLSEADPWPYSVLEGAASGLALLLSDCTGSHPDWLESPAACLVFRCGDVAELAATASRLAEDNSLMAGLQWSAREKSKRHTETEFCERFEHTARAAMRACRRAHTRG